MRFSFSIWDAEIAAQQEEIGESFRSGSANITRHPQAVNELYENPGRHETLDACAKWSCNLVRYGATPQSSEGSNCLHEDQQCQIPHQCRAGGILLGPSIFTPRNARSPRKRISQWWVEGLPGLRPRHGCAA